MRTRPPFRADHVGSLLRPDHLSEARTKWHKGEMPAEELTAIENDAIRDVVAKQETVGLKGVTDGEFRRDYWHLDFMFGFNGVDPSEEAYKSRFQDEDFVAPAAEVTGKVSYPDTGIMQAHFQFLKDATKQTAKFTIPSAAQFRHREGVHLRDPDAYPDIDAFWNDIGAAYNKAVSQFAAAGCKYIQVDDVNSALLCDERIRAGFSKYGDPDQMLEQNIEVNNAALANRPADMAATTHMCRGNFKSTYAAEGGYEVIAEKFLTMMDVDGFFMEYDDDRSGDFQPLRFLPKDKYAVIGIMTSKSPELESADTLKRRIDEAAKYAPLDQICISPQCGFASTAEGNKLTEDDQWRKLERLVEVAQDVWGD